MRDYAHAFSTSREREGEDGSISGDLYLFGVSLSKYGVSICGEGRRTLRRRRKRREGR